MANLLIVSVGVLGQLFPALELARRATELGHRVAFASREPSVGDRVAPYGYRFCHLASDKDKELRERAHAARRAGRLGRILRRREYVALAALRAAIWIEGPGIDDLLDDLQPDLVLIDAELHELIVLAQARRVPVVVLEYHVSSTPSPNIPPLSSRYLPRSGAWSAWRCALGWRLLSWRRAVRRLLSRLYLDEHDKLSTMRELCRRADLRFGRDIRLDQWHYYAFPRLPQWLLVPRELDLPWAKPCPGSDYLGSMILRVRQDDLPADEIVRLRSILADNDPRPLVLLTVGSMLSEISLYRRVIAAIRGQPLRLLVATGRQSPLEELEDVPSNVMAFSWLPIPEVIGHVAAVICHGGIGTLLESMSAGVPVLVYSNGGMDRDGNAVRVVFHGVGLRGSLRRDNTRRIRRHLNRLLVDPAFRENAQRLQQALQRYEDPSRLDAAICSALKGASGGDDRISA